MSNAEGGGVEPHHLFMGTTGRRVPLLRTDRLVLRPPEKRDIPAWFARATDREAASLAGDPVPDSIAAGEDWLARSRRHAAAGSRLQWSIDYPGVADGIGTVSLSVSAPAIGFVVGRAHWGRGLATEAAREVLSYGVRALGLREVSAEAVSRNSASLRVLAKLGFCHRRTFVDEVDAEQCEQYVFRAPEG